MESESQKVRTKLKALDVRPSKQRGQNFVVEPFVLEEIARFGKPQYASHVVEIGPGLGALTEVLADAGRLTLVEIEPQFCEDLRARFPKSTIINSDVRTVDFSTIGSELVVFGNLPYSFSTDIVFHILDNAAFVKRAVLLFQKEFSERLFASPGSRDYSVLSVMAQNKAEIIPGPVIDGDCFYPRAKVASQLVQLKIREQFLVPEGITPFFELVVRSSFASRRRKIRNSLSESKLFADTVLNESLEESGIDHERRAETVSIEEYRKLAHALFERSESMLKL